MIAEVLEDVDPPSRLPNSVASGNLGEALGEENILAAGLRDIENILPANTSLSDTSILRSGIDGAFTFRNADDALRAVSVEYKFTSGDLPTDGALGFLRTLDDGSRQMSSQWLLRNLGRLREIGVIDNTISNAIDSGPRLLAVSDITGETRWFQVITDPNDPQLVSNTIRIPDIGEFLNSL